MNWNSRKTGKVFGIFAMISLVSLMWYFSSLMVEPNILVINILVTIAGFLMIGVYLSEILKSPSKEKEDSITRFKNRISFHQKQIDIYNKEIEKLK